MEIITANYKVINVKFTASQILFPNVVESLLLSVEVNEVKIALRLQLGCGARGSSAWLRIFLGSALRPSAEPASFGRVRAMGDSERTLEKGRIPTALCILSCFGQCHQWQLVS